MIHRATREQDTEGRIVATLDDYQAVRGFVAGLLAEGVEATVPKTVRETVEAVARLNGATPEGGVSLARLAAKLGIDKSAASRRWNIARRRGYLKNEETRKGLPARLTLADSIPDDVRVLPTRAELEECCSVAGVPGGSEAPLGFRCLATTLSTSSCSLPSTRGTSPPPRPRSGTSSTS